MHTSLHHDQTGHDAGHDAPAAPMPSAVAPLFGKALNAPAVPLCGSRLAYTSSTPTTTTTTTASTADAAELQ